MNTILVTVAAVCLLLIAVAAMCVKVIFVKGGRFPSGHAHDIPELRRRGIGCASGSHRATSTPENLNTHKQ